MRENEPIVAKASSAHSSTSKGALRDLARPALISTIAGLALTASASASTLTWNDAAGNHTWNDSSTNWTAGSGNVAWTDGSDAVFTTSGSGNVTLATNVSPNSVTFASANAYTFVGSYGINGSGGFTATTAATGAVTFDNVNGYSGVTELSNGELLTLATSTGSTSIAGSVANSDVVVQPVLNTNEGSLYNEFVVDASNLNNGVMGSTISTTRAKSLTLNSMALNSSVPLT